MASKTGVLTAKDEQEQTTDIIPAIAETKGKVCFHEVPHGFNRVGLHIC